MSAKSGMLRASVGMGAIIAAALTLELLIRFFMLSPLQTVTNPVLGRMMRPHTSYLFGTEGLSHFRTNSLGFNDVEPPADLSNAILVIGDSYVEAVQVEPSRNFASVFRRLYPRQTIVAAGRAGFSPIAYPAVLAYVAKLSRLRDVVIVLNPSDMRDLRSAPVEYQLNARGEVVNIAHRGSQRPEGAEAEAFRSLVDRSGIFAVLNYKYTDDFKDWAASVRQVVGRLTGHRKARHPRPVRTLNDAQISQALALLIDEMKAAAAVKLIFVPILEYHGDGSVEETAESLEASNIFTRAAARAGLPLLNLEPALAARFRESGIPPNGFDNSSPGKGHLNADGHVLLARGIASVTGMQGAARP